MLGYTSRHEAAGKWVQAGDDYRGFIGVYRGDYRGYYKGYSIGIIIGVI